MSTPHQLPCTPDSGSPSPVHTPTNPNILNLPLHVNVINRPDGASQPPHYSNLISKTLNIDKLSLTVEEVLAEGGFGVILLVKTPDKKHLALKRVVVNSTRDYESVIGEVGVMSNLSTKTPHLLKSLGHVVYSYGTTFEVQNIMPLCSKNLLQAASSRMAKNSNFEVSEILTITLHVSSGLSYLHSAVFPVLHRDIKIENVLVQDDMYVLSDFGSATTKVWDPSTDNIACINEDLDRHTTLQYRSPEMVDLYGNRGAITVASDIWALGVSVFKLMSFKDPFESILAIQNRNFDKKLEYIKQKYTSNVVQLLETLLSEHQSVRPTCDEVIRYSKAALNSDWSHVSNAYTRMVEDKRLRDEVNKKQTSTASANVVMETTVTPRQRPKRGAGANVPAAAPATIIPPVLAAPPKSPKPVSPVSGAQAAQTIPDVAPRFFSPSQPAATTTAVVPSAVSPHTATPSPPRNPQTTVPAPCSWNPFDADPEISQDDNATAPENDNLPNPFDNAPFDYFKYQPILMSQDDSNTSPRYVAYAANNPFLYEPDYVHSYDVSNNNAISAGVCNLSFEENTTRETGSTLSNNNHNTTNSS